MEEEFYKKMIENAEYWKKHKQEYVEINKDSGSILKVFERKNEKDDGYDTIYQIDNELCEKKCNEFIEGFINGETEYQDSILNLGLMMAHLINKKDDFSPMADMLLKELEQRLFKED